MLRQRHCFGVTKTAVLEGPSSHSAIVLNGRALLSVLPPRFLGQRVDKEKNSDDGEHAQQPSAAEGEAVEYVAF